MTVDFGAASVPTSALRFPTTAIVSPPPCGSVVFVPENDAAERTADGLAQLGVLAQILGSLVAVVAITRR